MNNPYLQELAASKGEKQPATPQAPTGNPYLDELNRSKVKTEITHTGNKVLEATKQCVPGLDCSAFTQSTLGKIGAKVPRTAVEQFRGTHKVAKMDGDYSGLQPGDLVFFDNKQRDSYNTHGKQVDRDAYVNHVGIYVGNGQFIHDPGKSSDNRKVQNLGSYLKKTGFRFMGAGRPKEFMVRRHPDSLPGVLEARSAQLAATQQQSPQHPSSTAYDAPQKTGSVGARGVVAGTPNQTMMDMAKIGSGDLGQMTQGALGMLSGLVSGGAQSTREAGQAVTKPANEYLQKNFPSGMLLKPEVAKTLDSMGYHGKTIRKTIQNLDPSQAIPFVEQITREADAKGDSGLAQAGKGMLDMLYRVAEGDEEAATDLMGMWNAFAISAAGGSALKGLMPPKPKVPDAPKGAPVVPDISAQSLRMGQRGPTRTVKAGSRIVPDAPKVVAPEPLPKVNPVEEKPTKPQVVEPRPSFNSNPVGLANRSTDTVRKVIGEEPFAGVPRQKIESWAKGATEKGYTDPTNAHSIAKQILDGSKKGLDNEETVGLSSALSDLTGEFDSLSKKYSDSMKAGGDPAIATQIDDVSRKMLDIVEAGNKAGTDWGRTGVARQALMRADGGFEGILARRQKAAGRKLTTEEVKTAKAQADELKTLREQIAKHEQTISDLEAKTVVSTARKQANAVKRESIQLERQAIHKEIDDILKSAAASANDLGKVTYDALRFGKAAGKLAVNYAKEGVVVLDDIVGKVVDDFKARGIEGMTRQDVIDAMTDARKKNANEKAERAASDLQSVFAEARKERQARLSEIAQREREVARSFQREERTKALNALKAERDALKAEEKAAREAENWYWADVKRQQGEANAAGRAAARERRDASMRRWKASAQGQRAQTLNRIERLQEKLDFARSEGAILGQKSKLKSPEDPILNDLKVKEASVQRQMRLEDSRIRVQQKADTETKVDKALGIPAQIGNVMRDAITMLDWSWSGIQGSLAAGMNPKAWGKGFGAGFKNTFARGEKFIDNMEKLRLDPDFDKVIASGVELPGLQPDVVEEFFLPNLIDRVPGYRNVKAGSKQGWEAASTVTRYNLVKTWINIAERSRRPLTPDALKVLGENANMLSGRAGGAGGQAVRQWKAIGQTLFAPSWWLSQYQVLTAKPLIDAWKFAAKSGDTRPVKLMVAEYGKMVGEVWLGMLATREALNKMREMGLTDYQLETDFNDKKFGKIWARRGDTIIQFDFVPPQISAPLRTTFQLLGGSRKDDGSLNKTPFARAQAVGSMFEGKYGPGVGTGVRVLDSWRATDDPNDKTGKPKYPFGRNLDPRTTEGKLNLGTGLVTPISAQQGYGAVTSDKLSPMERTIFGIMSFLGRGPTIYKKED